MNDEDVYPVVDAQGQCLGDDYYDSGDDLEESSEFDDNDYNPYGGGATAPQVQWKQLRIGDAILDVSNDGRVKPYGAEVVMGEVLATSGTLLEGTPFRTYTVQVRRGDWRKYFMHDLVYNAFNGPPFEGYEVRHVPEYTRRTHAIYSNRLGCLTTSPILVSQLRLGSL